MWSKIGRLVAGRPAITASVISISLVASASYILNLNYEFDTMKSFPKDMPSRIGYEILEAKFDKGNLAQTTALYESPQQIDSVQREKLSSFLSVQPFVSSVRLNGTTEDKKVMQFSITFKESPYAVESMNALLTMRDEADKFITDNNLNGQLYFAGETAKKVDDRSLNNRDLVVIILLECVLILAMLVLMTRSIKMSVYMISTIVISFLAAMGLGMFLCSLFFDIHTISNRVPVYSFVFLVALGIDYNIVFISRFIEERAKSNVKKAVETAVATTGGVISSAGIILAATFAVLMTQPVQVLFVFGFIVSLGILLDTFFIRGILLPALIVLFEKDKKSNSWIPRSI
jgi:RND superfamily putative drug exporter